LELPGFLLEDGSKLTFVKLDLDRMEPKKLVGAGSYP
jgi:hypothetical protein